jgi:hypothetical protein
MTQTPHIALTEVISCRLNILFGNQSKRHILTSRRKKEDNIERNIKGER